MKPIYLIRHYNQNHTFQKDKELLVLPFGNLLQTLADDWEVEESHNE
jgi:hypothetical protein